MLGVDPCTISRELARYGRKTWRYNALCAQADAEKKRLASKHDGMKIEAYPALKRHIITELKRLRSPDEIAGRMKQKDVLPRVGTNAIYKWIYSQYGKPYCRYLCTRRSRKKKQGRAMKKIIIPDRIPLNERPDEPNLVHAERDLFVSPHRTGTTASGLLIVIPEAKLFAGSILPNRQSETVTESVKKHHKQYRMDTCTADNGVENVSHGKTGIPTYFCDRGAPWQKPCVEGGIGLIRRWFLPKGTDLSKIEDVVFQSQLHLLNHKYRRSLGYRSAYEIAYERGIIRRVPRISLSKAIAFR